MQTQPIQVNTNPNYLIRGLNFTADVFGQTIGKTGRLIAPTAFGMAGGWLTGVGASVGGFQGCATGVTYTWLLKPIGNYVRRHTGDGQDQIHGNTEALLYLSGTVIDVALPIFLTYKFGVPVLETLSQNSPEWLAYYLAPTLASNYTITKGVLANIAPMVVQLWLGWSITANENSRKQD